MSARSPHVIFFFQANLEVSQSHQLDAAPRNSDEQTQLSMSGQSPLFTLPYFLFSAPHLQNSPSSDGNQY
jgi:hypothetical protein